MEQSADISRLLRARVGEKCPLKRTVSTRLIAPRPRGMTAKSLNPNLDSGQQPAPALAKD